MQLCDRIFSVKRLLFFLPVIILEIFLVYEIAYKDRVYPGVSVEGKNLGNWKKTEIENFFTLKNKDFYQTEFVFSFEEKVATISGKELNWGYDQEKIAKDAYGTGRSGDFFQDFKTKLNAFLEGINLEASYSFDEAKLKEFLADFEKEIFVPPQDALFQFKDGRVTVFQKEKEGQKLDIEKAVFEIKEKLGESPDFVKIKLTTRSVKPEVTIDEANNLGIRELLGKGISYFWGSPSSRIHNIILASSRLNGVLIKPEEIFSLNQALGDVSLATGYQQAYVIKEGRTILDDGGGVCQVSTTLFRAALDAGLPILERWPHSYRVSYYEQGGFGPGLDATVFYPSVDLKFKNDTPAHILVQTHTDTKTKTLIFKLYGTSDGRQVEISQPKISEQTPPPEDLYKDEPSLPKGVIKQIERKAWGAKVSFDWKVLRHNEVVHEQRFVSSYQPWQAVYLRGVGE